MHTIVLAEDHPRVRAARRALLEAEADFRVIGETADGLEAVARTRELNPDVLVTDLMMPRLNGLEAAEQLLQDSPARKVVVISIHLDEPYVVRVLRLGVRGYVDKNASSQFFGPRGARGPGRRAFFESAPG